MFRKLSKSSPSQERGRSGLLASGVEAVRAKVSLNQIFEKKTLQGLARVSWELHGVTEIGTGSDKAIPVRLVLLLPQLVCQDQMFLATGRMNRGKTEQDFVFFSCCLYWGRRKEVCCWQNINECSGLCPKAWSHTRCFFQIAAKELRLTVCTEHFCQLYPGNQSPLQGPAKKLVLGHIIFVQGQRYDMIITESWN